MTYTQSGLQDTFQDGVTVHSAADRARANGMLNYQLGGIISALAPGIFLDPDTTSFAVTSGTGLSVNIAPGSAAARSSTLGGWLLRKTDASVLGSLAPSTTVYIHASIQTNTDPALNDSRRTGLPLFIASASSAVDGAVLLAIVVTGASTITSVTDARNPITAFTSEQVQDIVGALITDSITLDFTYTDGSNSQTAEVKNNSITNTHINSSAAIAFSKLENGTVDDTLAAPASAGTLAQILSWIAGRIKGITGKSSWLTPPAITLESASTRITALEAEPAQDTITDNYTMTQANQRCDLDSSGAGGKTINLPITPATSYAARRRFPITNVDSVNWTVAITDSAFADSTISMVLAPNETLETYVSRRANGSYCWSKT